MGGRRGQLPSPFFDALVARHAAVLDPFQSVRGVRHPFGQGWIPEVRIRQARKVFAYIEGAGLIDASMVSPPFRAGERRFISLTHRRLSPHAVKQMLKRRLAAARLPKTLSPHSFRVVVVTDLLSENVLLKAVQTVAGHAHPKLPRSTTGAAVASPATSSSGSRSERMVRTPTE